MGFVVRLKRNQLVGGNNSDDIYPITATNAVYRGNKNLEDILDELGSDVNSKKVTSVTYSEQDNSIQVKYSNGDVNNYTLNIQEPNNGKLTLTKGNNIVEFTANSAEDKSITIPNVYVDNAAGEYPKKPGSVTVDNYTLNLRALRIIPTFGVATGISLLDSNELTDAIMYRNTANLTHGASDVCAVRLYDNNEFLGDTAVLLPRLPKLVAAVSLSGNDLVITYLEDTVNSSQSETRITLPSGGSSVSVSGVSPTPTLERNTDKTIGNITVDGTTTQFKVNGGNMVESTSVADVVYITKSNFDALKNANALVSSRLYLVQAETSA